MCRLLTVKSKTPFSITGHLKNFAGIAQNSKEYQGHGWGCSFRRNGNWLTYKSILPIWEDDLDQFGETTMLLAHARSAFKNEGITVENNMPFTDADRVFIFNGELHGVRIRETGRIGAEKIFNTIRRLNDNNDPSNSNAFRKAVAIIEKRSEFVKAMNIIMADENRIYIHSLFNRDPDYFTMHKKQEGDRLILCSEPYPNDSGWERINNRTLETWA